MPSRIALHGLAVFHEEKIDHVSSGSQRRCDRTWRFDRWGFPNGFHQSIACGARRHQLCRLRAAPGFASCGRGFGDGVDQQRAGDIGWRQGLVWRAVFRWLARRAHRFMMTMVAT
ncbi:hypothetical protein OKW33_007076 [Paraburkholderia atlantica]